MKTFIKSIKCLNNLFCVFEDDGETGYLYVYSPVERKIFVDLIVYQIVPNLLQPTEKDVQLEFDNSSNHGGVYVWNKLRGYIILPDIKRERLRFSSPNDPGIMDSALSEEYDESKQTVNDDLITEELFIIDRQNYWKKIAQNLENKK